jgi:hypothetical protein
MPERQPPRRLSQLLYELQQAGFHCDGLGYRKLWQGAVERHFPAHQVNGLWHFQPEDVPAIAAAYGLRLRHKTGTRKAA